MIETQDTIAVALDHLGVLTRDFRARLVNYSRGGCLLEMNLRVEVGTIGTLRFIIEGYELADDVQVVRCQPIEGAGSMYQVGVRFLWTLPPGKSSLRSALGAATNGAAMPIDGSRAN